MTDLYLLIFNKFIRNKVSSPDTHSRNGSGPKNDERIRGNNKSNYVVTKKFFLIIPSEVLGFKEKVKP